jgi:3-deoxy-7-phosphoheptulonate synthase
MFVVLRPGCLPEDRQRVVAAIEAAGLCVEVSEGHHRIVIGVVGNEDKLRDTPLATFRGVEKVVPLKAPYRLAARETQPHDTVVRVGDAVIGGNGVCVIAGPCAVEAPDAFLKAATAARAAGAQILRGGAFKPRTAPYNFQGLGAEGLVVLREVSNELGMPVVTEAMDTRHVELVAEHADMLQIGTRNMQNFPLLKSAAQTGLPVLLKRGRASTVAEWLCAAEYVLSGGNPNVVLCERGLVSFDSAVRNLLDLSCVPLVKRLSHLPIVVDPSHATGKSELVPAMARAAVAAGADGVMVEVHPSPPEALSDARQAILPDTLLALVPGLNALREVLTGVGVQQS